MTSARRAVLGAFALVGAALLTACGQGGQAGQDAVRDAVQVAAGDEPTLVSVAARTAGDLGTVLTNGEGRTLYRFDEDSAAPSLSTCGGDCAAKWPPALVTSEDVRVQGVDQALVGTFVREDGSEQLTVAGWPLYTFAQDRAAGDTEGHGAGGTWFAVTPEGEKAGEVALTTAVVPGLGTVLTDARGLTLYRFDRDTASPPKSTCDGDCAAKWPPVTVTSEDVRVQGVDQALVGTVVRGDGSEQLTVAGWPVYRFAQDRQPGDAKGQGAGGTWFAAAPDGKKAARNAALVLTTASVGSLGTVLTDEDGMTLYRFDEDAAAPSLSTCEGECAVKWPPLLVDSDAFQVQGVDRALVGTVVRADGGKQVTVAGWPLYTFSGDEVCGEANGHGLGGVWFAATPEGEKAG